MEITYSNRKDFSFKKIDDLKASASIGIGPFRLKVSDVTFYKE